MPKYLRGWRGVRICLSRWHAPAGLPRNLVEIGTMRVNLSPGETAFLSSATFLPDSIAQQLKSTAERSSGRAHFDVPDGEAESLRSIFTEQLAAIGFDESYKPTAEGLILEQLIDKLFVA
jgi:hypothetical protein